MCNIYFDNKVITFTRKTPLFELPCWQIEKGERVEVTKVLQKLENNKNLHILSNNPQEVFSDFCSQFIVLEAAGGLVRNTDGEALMIFRNDRWDLPKGHLEREETIEECATREVEEECGICGLELGQMITITQHFYLYEDCWYIKQCHWYSMFYGGVQRPIPQKEEGITDVEWLSEDSVNAALLHSYTTIAEVFDIETKLNLK